MADSKLTGLSLNADPQDADELYLVNEGRGGSPASEAVTMGTLLTNTGAIEPRADGVSNNGSSANRWNEIWGESCLMFNGDFDLRSTSITTSSLGVRALGPGTKEFTSSGVNDATAAGCLVNPAQASDTCRIQIGNNGGVAIGVASITSSPDAAATVRTRVNGQYSKVFGLNQAQAAATVQTQDMVASQTASVLFGYNLGLQASTAPYLENGGSNSLMVATNIAFLAATCDTRITGGNSNFMVAYNAGGTITQNANSAVAFINLNNNSASVSHTGDASLMSLSSTSSGAVSLTGDGSILVANLTGTQTANVNADNAMQLGAGSNGTANSVQIESDTQLFGNAARLELRKDGTNSGLYFGAGPDAKLYYDGTDVVLDPDDVGGGIVLIGATGDNDMRLTNIEIDGALNHDGSTAGFFNTTPTTRQTGYTTFSNLGTLRTLNANSTNVDELADVLGTLIEDLKTLGLIAA